MIRSVLPGLLLVLTSFSVFSQQERIVLDLTEEPAALFKSYKFFIQDVEDQRNIPGAAMGKVIAFGKEIPVVLPAKADKELFTYWSFAAPKKQQTYLPLYISIKDLSLNEKRTGPNRGDG
jgi:hypothetical protein